MEKHKHKAESLNTMNVTTVLKKIVLFIASAIILELEGRISPSSFFGQLLVTRARLLVTRFSPYLPSGWVFLQRSKNVGLVQNFILMFCFWCESRELGGRGNSRFSCVTPAVETFSDRVAFRVPSNISDGAPLQKQPKKPLTSRG